jgi:hypothetical protein
MSPLSHRIAPEQRSGRISTGNLLLALGGGLAAASALALSLLTSDRASGAAADGGGSAAGPRGVVLAGESATPGGPEPVVLLDPLAAPEDMQAEIVEQAPPAAVPGAQSATAAAPAPAALAANDLQDDGPKLRYESVPGAKKERVRQEDLRAPKRRSAQAGQEPAGAQKDPPGNKKPKQAQNRRFPKKKPAPEGGG